VSAFLPVLSSIVGFALLIFPWTEVWDGNYLLLPYPLLRSLATSMFTRGAVSGLGLVNLVLAFHEARRRLSGEGRGQR
jgi:hypothetical protein